MASLEVLEKKNIKAASNGLLQAINDCVEMSFHLNPEIVAKLDEQLRDQGIVTLSELPRRYSKKYASIVKRGRIKNDTEYYLIQNVQGDPTTKTPEERALLERLVTDYEGV
ncbi:MAG: hypothetical protein ISP49_03950 [Reyranella sp.]|nr:hypothetical protein [Reyranella sp.]MBL6650721.1 hypothetical protein [Reyranella sp.]